MAKAYERIADELRMAIRTGQLKLGDQLPSKSALVERFGRSRVTVREALRVLQVEGLIEKQHGRGSFARRPRTLVQRNNGRHQWEKNRARQSPQKRSDTGATEHDTGLGANDLVFHAAYREIEAPEKIAAAMGVPEGTALVERGYRTQYSAKRVPFALGASYLIRERVVSNPELLGGAKETWTGGTWVSAAPNPEALHTVGIEIDRVEERVTARPPKAEEAEELDLPPGTSVLVLRKTSYDTEGLVAEMSDLTPAGDRTELLFTTYLERW